MNFETVATAAAGLGALGTVLYFLLLGIGTEHLPDVLEER